MIVLRFAHVFVGPLWVGMMVFQIFFLGPTVAELGPDGGKVMGGLMRRRIPIVMPLLGLITIISGLWLFQRDSGGNMGAFMDTPMGKAFGWGGLSAILAFLIGVIGVRPLMMRMVKQGPTLPADEMQRLRARAEVLGTVVTVLMLLTLAAMSVARYL
ncbi:MAG TPA: hypothetical protein VIV83_12800 [Gemmatimonadales bacterium]|jgi:hypothetical protein